MFKPTRAQILQAWDDREEGRPLSKEMALYLDKLDKAMDVSAVETQTDTQLEEAKLLAVEYDKVLDKLAALPDRVLTLLAPQFPHVTRAARGKQTRDHNKKQYEEQTARLSKLGKVDWSRYTLSEPPNE